MDASKIVKAANAPTPKLVKRESISAMLDAVTILDVAREQARAILKDAEDRRQSVFDEAKFEGEQTGLRSYLEAVTELRAEADDYYLRAESELVKLGPAIAKKIIGEELRMSPTAIATIVREALTSARRANTITIRMHPDDVRTLSKNRTKLGAAAGATVEFDADAEMLPGGCVIESELGIVDARLETQLKVIEAALLRGRT